MATLQSPGVSVTVVDDSIYAPAGPGTVPLFVVASHKNKKNSDGTVYEGTAATENNGLRLVTTRNELVSLYGLPKFDVENGTVNHGSEIAEYGLHGVWRALNQVNRAYVLMSDIDLGQLKPTSVEPSFPVEAGTHWLELSRTHIGVFEASDGAWNAVTPIIVKDSADMEIDASTASMRPRKVIGMPNDFALVIASEDTNNDNQPDQVRMAVWEKIVGDWYMVGTDDWKTVKSADFKFSQFEPRNFNDGDVYIRTKEKRGGTSIVVSSYNDVTETFEQKPAPLFNGGDEATEYYITTDSLYEGQIFVDYDDYNVDGNTLSNSAVAMLSIKRLKNDGAKTEGMSVTDFTDIDISATTYNIDFAVNGTTASVTVDASMSSDGTVVTLEDFVVSAQVAVAPLKISLGMSNGRLVVSQLEGYEVRLRGDVSEIGFAYNDRQNTQVLISNWEQLVHEVSDEEPKSGPKVGTLWYDDTMYMTVYKNMDGAGDWQEQMVTVRSEAPENASEGDLWVDSNSDSYPHLFVFKDGEWSEIDITNEEVIVFDNMDNRSEQDSMVELLFVDMDKSGMVVKEYQASGEWVSVSGNAPDGSPYMGYNAQRQMVVRSLKRAVLNSKEARSRTNFFNLIAAPGYMELLPELNSLNVAKKQTAFVVGSSPMNLKDSADYVQRWATNQNGAFSDGEKGLVTFNNMSAIWAYSGLQSDGEGNLVAVPSDVLALETILQNDRIAYPWFAPAGDTRGLVPATSAIGYTDGGEFKLAEMDDGLLDTLYINNINPIVNFPNEGIKVWGQKTLTSVPSAMDRINVARLIAYMRYMLDRITRPFLFEQNDAQTRQAVVNVVEKFLAEIVQKRGIQDFVVICDSSNNTPARIDRNELWCDVVFAPTKVAEFIYVPVRIVNTGEV